MKNVRIYVITIIISVVLIVPIFFSESTLANVFSSAGCSGITAALLAFFIERESNKREMRRMEKTKQLYFSNLNEQLSMLMGRILWFEERLVDLDFNWNLDESEYMTMNYMVAMGTKYPERIVSYNEAVCSLKVVGERCNLDNLASLPENENKKIKRMFSIISVSTIYLLNELKRVKEDALVLENENYLSLDDNEHLIFELAIAIEIMEKPDKNFDVAIKNIIAAADKIREIGGYSNDIQVGLHGSIQFGEL